MKKVLAILVAALGLGLVGFGIYNYTLAQRPNAVLRVESNPPALVFVDNVQLGQTPVEKGFKPGEVSVKLIPVASSTSLATYQTKVRLVNNVKATVRRDFGASEAESAGETISLDLGSTKDEASLSIVASGPDVTSVVIDGEPVGFTPYLAPSIGLGDHQITLSAPGFVTRRIEAVAVAGYRLSINARLAAEKVLAASTSAMLDLDAPASTAGTTTTSTPKPSASPKVVANVAKPYVEIKETPTGFLRVRQTPSTSGTEIGQVSPGEKFPLLQTGTGWYQIKVSLSATTSGWISAQYADKFE